MEVLTQQPPPARTPQNTPGVPPVSGGNFPGVEARVAIGRFFEKAEQMARNLELATGVPVRLVKAEDGFVLPPAVHDTCVRAHELSDSAGECLRFHRTIRGEAQTQESLSRTICRNGFLNGTIPIIASGRVLACVEVGPVHKKKASCEPAFRLVEFLAHQLRQEAASVAQGTDPEIPDPIRKAIRHIRENLCQPLALADAAKAAALSPDRFSRVLRQHTGRTFSSFIAALRVERACAMLKTSPHARISDIAMECGFESIPHFNRIFSKITGLNPSRFRLKEAATAGPVQQGASPKVATSRIFPGGMGVPPV